MWLICILCYVPVVAAKGREQPFPNITFKMFNKFVEDHFSSTVTLSVVLMTLFTITENVDLLSLHFHQRSAEKPQERAIVATGWISCLGHALNNRLKETGSHLLKESKKCADEKAAIEIGLKIDALARVLGLCPSNNNRKHKYKLKSVSKKSIQPIYIVCPGVPVCQTYTCNKTALYQWSRQRDIPLVQLIKDFIVHDKVPVLSGYCKNCKTLYYADHERSPTGSEVAHERVYLNTAKYIKIGQNMWVDRRFSSTVLSGMYIFHGSASAFADFCNDVTSRTSGAVYRLHAIRT
jgi:CxC5 like cysteine cluster associated with KDZ transposases